MEHETIQWAAAIFVTLLVNVSIGLFAWHHFKALKKMREESKKHERQQEERRKSKEQLYAHLEL